MQRFKTDETKETIIFIQYTKGINTMMIKAEKAVAAAIDFQEKLVPAIADKETLITNTVKLLTGLNILGVPVYITQQYTRGLGMTVAEITEAAGKTDYVEKIRFGACEDLTEVMPSPEEKPYVIVFGIESHICVLQTLIGLKEAGYQPVLVTDCSGSRKQKDMEIALERAKQEGIILATYESILFELLHEAGSDTFKQISRLVK